MHSQKPEGPLTPILLGGAAITRRHSTEGLPGPKHESQGNLRPDWTHHLERYKQRAGERRDRNICLHRRFVAATCGWELAQMANMPERLALPARFNLNVDQAYSALCTILFPLCRLVIPQQSNLTVCSTVVFCLAFASRPPVGSGATHMRIALWRRGQGGTPAAGVRGQGAQYQPNAQEPGAPERVIVHCLRSSLSTALACLCNVLFACLAEQQVQAVVVPGARCS